MADEQLRWGERRWRAGGSPEDEARHLRARLRAGRVDPIRLALAAECGHPAARVALGRASPRPGSSLREVASRVERAADDEARVRATATLAQALLATATDALARGAAERALVACEEWLRCPCPGHLGLALRAWGALEGGELAVVPGTDAPAALLRLAVRAVERRGVSRRAVAHLRVSWLPWLVA